MKYLVMETHLSYAVVLDENSRFLKTANMNYEVGQTVDNVVCMRDTVKQNNHKWIYSVAGLAACLILVFTVLLNIPQTPYASVYMEINPSLKIDINENDIVIDIEGQNNDGNDLIKGYSYKDKNLDLVVDELVDRSIEMGYLHEGGQITLKLDSESGEWIVSHEDTLGKHIDEYLSKKISVTITIDGKIVSKQAVNIPVAPTEKPTIKPYSESDYGVSESSNQLSASSSTKFPSVVSDNTNYGDSQYEESDNDDGQTDYNVNTNYDDTNKNQSAYEESDNATDYSSQSDNNQSDYESSDIDNDSSYSASNYENNDNDD